jgi:arsenite-transporting ATPase
MRVVLFTGKGGVGKTTLAAATSARLAHTGRKVLVVSTDPAHSLGDALGRHLGAEPVEVDTGMFAGHIDSRGLVDQAWSQLRTHLRTVLSGAGIDEVDAEELTVLPGVDELLSLVEVHRLTRSGPWDTVIVDCGPTAETLRLLALPEAFSGYLGKLFPGGKRSTALLSPSRLLGDDWQATHDALQSLAKQLTELRALLTDRHQTSVRLVLTPERVVVAETRRTLTALALQGIRVDGVIANRVVPKAGLGFGPAATWMRTRRAEQDAVLAEVRASADVEMRTVEHRAKEPVGAESLLELADQLYGRADPLGSADEGAPPLLAVRGGGRGDAEYRLHIAIPLSNDADLDLARIGDDLAVTVDGRRRLIALPSVLRRCTVRSAEVDDEGIVVRMRARGSAR